MTTTLETGGARVSVEPTLRILIVEDESLIALELESLLQETGTSRSALRRARANRRRWAT